MARKKKVLRARALRKELTGAEQVLWQHLRNRKFLNKKFRRQHVFCGFILDFYCPEERLGIELDGSVHLKQKDYDALRQKIIEDNEVETEIVQRRALRVKEDLDVGSIIERDNIISLRPCPKDAIPPYKISEIIGKLIKEKIKKGDYIKWEYLRND